MAQYDGDVKIGVSLHSNGIQQSLNNLKKTIQRALGGKEADNLDRNIVNANKSLQQTQKEFQKIQSEIAKTEDKLREYETRYNLIRERGSQLQTKTNTKEYDGLFYSQKDYDNLKMLDTKLGNIGARLDELNGESERLSASLSQVGIGPEVTEGAAEAAGSLGDMETAATGATAAISPWAAIGTAVLSIVKKIASAAVNLAKKVGSVLVNAFKKFGTVALNVLKKVGQSILNVSKNIISKVGNAITSPFQNLGNKITGLFKKISTSIRKVFFLSVLTGAFRDIRSAISNLITSNEELNRSLKQIKSNLLTAFAPIYNAALPAINALMNAIAKATGYIAAFFSALTGNSIGSSFEQAKDIYEQAQDKDGNSAEADRIDAEIDALEDKIKAIEKERNAYEKAKKAEEQANKKSLLSFDELNQLAAPEKEDETLAAYDAQIEALEEQLEVLQDMRDAIKDVSDAAEELSYPEIAETVYDEMTSFADMIKEAWGDGDFTDIGSKLKDSIISIGQKIDWKGVFDASAKIGSSIATFFNGLIDEDFGDAVGEFAGNVINTIFEGISEFAEKVDASQIGISLSNFIIRAIDTIDWGRIEETAKTIGTKLADFINSAINPESFGHLGEALGNIIQSVLESIGSFVANIDGANLGASLSAFIVSACSALDWESIKATAMTAGQKLADFFNNAINPESFGQLGYAIGSAIQTAIEFVYGFIQTIDAANIGASLSEFIVRGCSAINIDTVQTTMQQIGRKLADFLNNAITPESASSLGEKLGGLIQSAIDFLHEFLSTLDTENLGKSISSFINSAIEQINFQELGETLRMIFETLAKTMESIVANVDWSAVGDAIKKAIAGALGDIDWGNIAKNLIDGLISAIRYSVGGISGGIGNLLGSSLVSNISAPRNIPITNIPTDIPRLATGAVIPPNREFMAVLGDQKSGTNVEAPLSTIKQAVADVIGNGNFGGSPNVNITFGGSLAQLGRVLKPQIELENSRVGQSLSRIPNRTDGNFDAMAGSVSAAQSAANAYTDTTASQLWQRVTQLVNGRT